MSRPNPPPARADLPMTSPLPAAAGVRAPQLVDDTWTAVMHLLDGPSLLACRHIDTQLSRVTRSGALPGHHHNLQAALDSPRRFDHLHRDAEDFVADILAHMPSVRLGKLHDVLSNRRADRALFGLVTTHMRRASRLEVYNLDLGPRVGMNLSQGLRLSPVRDLTLDGCNLQAIGGHHLLQQAFVAKLSSLDLSNNNLTDAVFESLSCATHITELRVLSLQENNITDAGLAGFRKSPHLSTVNYLSIGYNPVKDIGCLSGILPLQAVQDISLAQTEVDHEDLFNFLQASWLRNLARLDLNGVALGPEVGNVFARVPHLESMAILHMDDAQLGPQGIWPITQSLHLRTLVSLSLARNDIGDEGAFVIGESEVCADLQMLDVQDNNITVHGGRCLATGRFIGPHLTHLDLRGNAVTHVDFYQAVTMPGLNRAAVLLGG